VIEIRLVVVTVARTCASATPETQDDMARKTETRCIIARVHVVELEGICSRAMKDQKPWQGAEADIIRCTYVLHSNKYVCTPLPRYTCCMHVIDITYAPDRASWPCRKGGSFRLVALIFRRFGWMSTRLRSREGLFGGGKRHGR
jgi:hypothetical protein